MLSMSELAMNPNRKVKTKCYGEVKVWADPEEAYPIYRVSRYRLGRNH